MIGRMYQSNCRSCILLIAAAFTLNAIRIHSNNAAVILDVSFAPPEPQRQAANPQPRLALNNNNSENYQSNENVRRWGCDRTETPFIFVHLGKAGKSTQLVLII